MDTVKNMYPLSCEREHTQFSISMDFSKRGRVPFRYLLLLSPEHVPPTRTSLAVHRPFAAPAHLNHVLLYFVLTMTCFSCQHTFRCRVCPRIV
jgi:hypothetical protein